MSLKINILSFLFTTLFFVGIPVFIEAQVTLDANGPGSTYELINSKLAPGYTAVETPDQCASHPSFGRHIAEVFDATLNKYVFEFYIHVPTTFPVGTTTADNDRCQNFDRQRVEIKTYEPSPANLKGTVGETVNYKWKFRLPTGFQPSPNFTHIHQVKAVGGDEGDPLFTLTVRAGTPNILQLLYVKDSATSATELSSINLANIAGVWVEATEVVQVGANGTFSMEIKRVDDGTNLLSYSTSSIETIRPSNTFIRPKWGIYRSLNSPTYLRDDSIRIASISIQEGVLPVTLTNFSAQIINKKTLIKWNVENEINFSDYEIEQSSNGVDFVKLAVVKPSNQSAYSYEYENTNHQKQYFRLKLIDNNGKFSYSNIVVINANSTSAITVYPNPAKDFITVNTNEIHPNSYFIISNVDGKGMNKISAKNSATTISTVKFSNGLYYIKLIENNQTISTNQFIISR